MSDAELYVYYKLDPAQAAAARRALETARQHLPADVDLRVLMRQEALQADAVTWMEIYRSLDGRADLDAAQQAIAAAMTPFCLQGRHIERFRSM